MVLIKMKRNSILIFLLSIVLCLSLFPTGLVFAGSPDNQYVQSDDHFTERQIPDYYRPHLSEKINVINNLSRALKDGKVEADNVVQFIWFTDYHFDPNEYDSEPSHVHCNTKNSPALMEKILMNTEADKILFGGDIANAFSLDKGQKYLFDCLLDFKQTFRFAEGMLYTVNGNHEYFSNIPPTYSQLSEILRDGVISKAYSVDYYGDYTIKDDTDKICYIMINSSNDVFRSHPDLIKDAQIHYLFNQLLHVPDGYSIIIVTHSLLNFDGIKNGHMKWSLFPSTEKISDGLTSFANRTVHVFDSISYDFSNVNADIICCLAGHMHFDAEYILPSGVPIILTTCDTVRKRFKEYDKESAAWIRAYDYIDTYREQAFDIVTIDKEQRRIYLTRIGDEGIAYDGQHKKNGDRIVPYPTLIQ